MRKSDKNGYVYLICDPIKDFFKIGITTGTIEKRIKELQTGNAGELFIRDYFKTDTVFKLEQLLHSKFILKHIHGEWFQLDVNDVLNFRKTCEELQTTAHLLYESTLYDENLI